MNQKNQKPNQPSSHSIHNHDEEQQHQQDDCEDCQRQRAQNNQLIEFYERLHKLKEKVTQIKPSLHSQTLRSQQQKSSLQHLDQKIVSKPDLQSELNKNGGSMKNMGYELAIALLEREIKMKRENQKISRRIRQLQKESQRLKRIEKDKSREVEASLRESWDTSSADYYQSRRIGQSKQASPSKGFNDSLDTALEQSKGFWSTGAQRKSSKTKQVPKFSKDPFFSADNSSTFSSFQDQKTHFKRQTNESKQKYSNLNLWLYQYDSPDKLPELPILGSKKKSKR